MEYIYRQYRISTSHEVLYVCTCTCTAHNEYMQKCKNEKMKKKIPSFRFENPRFCRFEISKTVGKKNSKTVCVRCVCLAVLILVLVLICMCVCDLIARQHDHG